MMIKLASQSRACPRAAHALFIASDPGRVRAGNQAVQGASSDWPGTRNQIDTDRPRFSDLFIENGGMQRMGDCHADALFLFSGERQAV